MKKIIKSLLLSILLLLATTSSTYVLANAEEENAAWEVEAAEIKQNEPEKKVAVNFATDNPLRAAVVIEHYICGKTLYILPPPDQIKRIYLLAENYYKQLDQETLSDRNMKVRYDRFCRRFIKSLQKEENWQKIANFSEGRELFERASYAYKLLGNTDKAEEMKRKDAAHQSIAQENLQQDLQRPGVFKDRGNLSSQVDRGRLQRFIGAFKKRATSAKFQAKFPKTKFSDSWWESVQKLCLEESELDFQSKVFHASSLYNATQIEKQTSFEVGCSFIVQMLSKCIRDEGLTFENTEELAKIFEEVARLRALMQKESDCPDWKTFKTPTKGELDDPIFLNAERILYLRQKVAENKVALCEYDEICVSASLSDQRAVTPDVAIDDLTFIHHTHRPYRNTIAENGLENLFNQFYQAGDLPQKKRILLRFFYNYSRSSMFPRGQGATLNILTRTLLNTVGCKMVYASKWHVDSKLFPPDVDAFYARSEDEFVDDNLNCLEIQEYSPPTFEKVQSLLMSPE